jgi:DHA1 family bicyclomycin/chloramphenicol resistance-like MFS transporter
MSPVKPLPQREFIALLALLFATVALSIDAMLPALPDIGASLSPQDLNRAQLVITSFVLGMGVGTLFTGPLSDRFGRKIVVQLGLVIYGIGAMLCYLAPSLEILLVARILQGLGVSAPRAVSMAIVRDLYSGREMAKIVSFAQMIFTTVPALAPIIGVGIIWLAGWQAIFLAYLIFAAACALWFGLRQPETLPVSARRPLALKSLVAATREMFSHPDTTISILVQSLTLGMLFATLSSMQGIFEQQFDRASSFPLWFGVIALVSMGGSFINAQVVMTLGMRKVLLVTFIAQFTLSTVLLALFWLGLMPPTLAFVAFILWSIGLFAMMGTTMGNLNALAMEPLGHIAGLVASVMSSIATVISVLLAVPVGLMFDGTNLPLMTGVTLYAGLALLLMRYGMGPGRA